ncbi:hypothetical protein H4CHR_02228 [Variovorax sp. PBS-H4]|nr:hypothetical protein H4CHR_02228 [Variovorax sp. PBS-H4]
MKLWSAVAAWAMLTMGLVGCGGGGGGGGGGMLPILPTAPASMSTTVKVNGATAAADANGQFPVKPGDTVEVAPNQDANWSSASAPADAVTLRNPDTTSTKWSAQIVNTTTDAATFTVTARATANASLAKDTVLKVAAGNARNASYRVFSTNGSQLTLALNFDTMSYTLTDGAGAVVTDAFVTDPQVSDGYVFKSSRISTPVNNARFRLAANTVVGAFPFAVLTAATPTFAVQPFIASNALVTSQAALAGTYNRLGINLNSSGRDSNIRGIEVTAGGAQVLMCNEVAITPPVNCPPASLMTYTVSPGTSPSSWRIVNVANPNDSGAFSVATINGQNVYLSAGSSPNGDVVFRVGTPQVAAWPLTTGIASDTDGTWGPIALDTTQFGYNFVRADASSGSLAFGLQPIGQPTTLNIRADTTAGPGHWFAVQGAGLTAVVGARGPNGGYMLIGLAK